jgi:hypothetical protein
MRSGPFCLSCLSRAGWNAGRLGMVGWGSRYPRCPKARHLGHPSLVVDLTFWDLGHPPTPRGVALLLVLFVESGMECRKVGNGRFGVRGIPGAQKRGTWGTHLWWLISLPGTWATHPLHEEWPCCLSCLSRARWNAGGLGMVGWGSRYPRCPKARHLGYPSLVVDLTSWDLGHPPTHLSWLFSLLPALGPRGVSYWLFPWMSSVETGVR